MKKIRLTPLYPEKVLHLTWSHNRLALMIAWGLTGIRGLSDEDCFVHQAKSRLEADYPRWEPIRDRSKRQAIDVNRPALPSWTCFNLEG